MADDNNATLQEFQDTVNMTAGELEKWLDTEESNTVGEKSGSGVDRPRQWQQDRRPVAVK